VLPTFPSLPPHTTFCHALSFLFQTSCLLPSLPTPRLLSTGESMCQLFDLPPYPVPLHKSWPAPRLQSSVPPTPFLFFSPRACFLCFSLTLCFHTLAVKPAFDELLISLLSPGQADPVHRTWPDCGHLSLCCCGCPLLVIDPPISIPPYPPAFLLSLHRFATCPKFSYTSVFEPPYPAEQDLCSCRRPGKFYPQISTNHAAYYSVLDRYRILYSSFFHGSLQFVATFPSSSLYAKSPFYPRCFLFFSLLSPSYTAFRRVFIFLIPFPLNFSPIMGSLLIRRLAPFFLSHLLSSSPQGDPPESPLPFP